MKCGFQFHGRQLICGVCGELHTRINLSVEIPHSEFGPFVSKLFMNCDESYR